MVTAPVGACRHHRLRNILWMKITIKILNSPAITCDTHMQALAALSQSAKDDGHDLDSIILAVKQAFICREKHVKYTEPRRIFAKTQDEVLDFFTQYKGLISNDLYDEKIKHVTLHNLQLHLP